MIYFIFHDLDDLIDGDPNFLKCIVKRTYPQSDIDELIMSVRLYITLKSPRLINYLLLQPEQVLSIGKRIDRSTGRRTLDIIVKTGFPDYTYSPFRKAVFSAGRVFRFKKVTGNWILAGHPVIWKT